MSRPTEPTSLSTPQRWSLALLRVVIGWHFLYEGLAKLFTPGWSSGPYLDLSRWWFAGCFQWIANHPTALAVVDALNIWGLILIGLALIVGCLTRVAAISGMLLLALYYVADPPFASTGLGLVPEGQVLIINKNIIELVALLMIAIFPAGRFIGLDRLLARWPRRRRIPVTTDPTPASPCPDPSLSIGRRDIVKSLGSLPFLGAFALALFKKHGRISHEEEKLVDAVTRATIKTFDLSTSRDLHGTIPSARIGNRQFSRLILGGNLIGGWAHARDLLYVSTLVKAYHHRKKVFETFLLAEKCGINTILTNPVLCDIINDYWKHRIGKIQFISDCGGRNLVEGIKTSIDKGASACYLHGGIADGLVRRKKFDDIANALDLIRQNGLPAGVGGHHIETIRGCAEQGITPDFWMKTVHHTDYWSALPKPEYDNIFCRKPDETIAFMQDVEQPWIGFKTLAAGAIKPEEGFRYAFENGADFICVGMYDFQIVDDVNLTLDILNGKLNRQRPWRA